MANKDIAIEYTEEKYFSRNEMSKNIGFPVSDLMWKKVTDYRETFTFPLSLKWLGTKKLNICLYPTLSSKSKKIENIIDLFIEESNQLDKTNGSFQHFKLSNLKKSLLEIIRKDHADIDEARLTKLIASENPFDQQEDKLVNYINALKYIEENYKNDIDENFIGELYTRITGVSELTYFYRDRDITNSNSMSLISRVYDSAPFEYIEEMMNSLFDFVKNGSISVIEKALIAYKYFLMVKPFRDFNEEMSILIAKAIICHFGHGELAAYLNVESFLNQKEDFDKKISNEVQANCDLTYFVAPYIDILLNSIDENIDLAKEYNYQEFKKDFYQIDETSHKEINAEPMNEEIKEEKVQPVEETKPEEVKNTEEVTQSVKVVNSTEGLAINFIPPVLDEKVAQRLEQNLLEMDVLIKKGEAKFYARHCTLGMYYTIDQYKKCIRCVYETARTSMEHLVQLGYYSKKQVGKKFVYTPVERK
ncbi:MAG: hypothetical protein MJ225_00410 [Bacilli bacterium]|nr:hypothetical protein [Bacilli bacterium]